MKIVLNLFVLVIFVIYHTLTYADCSPRNCNDICRVNLIIGNVVEPACKATCEAANKACIPQPSIPPPPPWKPEGDPVKITKILAFNATVDTVRRSCSLSSFNSQADSIPIEEAKRILVNTGMVAWNEFSDINIRWCNGYMNADGFTASANEIILSRAVYGNPASTLGHELQHVRQFRRLGSDRFKIDYVTYMANCSGCQDKGHPYEREAIDFEDRIAAVMNWAPNQSVAPPSPSVNQGQPMQTGTVCQTAVNACSWVGPVGWNCLCASPNGLAPGVIR